MDQTLGETALESARRLFKQYKELAEGALAQIEPAAWFHAPDTDANSIAVIVQHVAGNLRSRWTDFLTTDGEKPDRNRDAEFEIASGTTVEQLRHRWDDGWQRLFATLDTLQPDDLLRTVTIRGQSLSVIDAIGRQLAHNAYHVGQIVQLARHYHAGEWRSLSIPRPSRR